MEITKKEIKYPQNLYLIGMVEESGISVTKLAKKINVSRQVLSNTIHGHYLGENIKADLLKILNK